MPISIPSRANDNQLSNVTFVDGFQAEILCLYPVSGQFTGLQRILYYLLMLFSIATRSHQWLVVGSLVAAMTYSGVAAIYGMAAAAQRTPRVFERDSGVVWNILTTSILLAIPLLNWSSTIRRLHARTIMIYWVVLIFIGACSIYAAGLKEVLPPTSTMTCTRGPDIPPLHIWPPYTHIDQQFLQTYSCSNPCTNITYENVFRTPADQTLPTLWNLISPPLPDPQSAEMMVFLSVSSEAKGYIAAIIGCQGLLYIGITGRRSPQEFRNLITYKIMRYAGRNLRSRQIWRAFSKTIALLCYIWMVLVLVICPPVALLAIVDSEIGYWNQVESEPFTAIGQWSPWAAVALTVAAAVISKYHARAVGWVQGGCIILKAQISKFVCFVASSSTLYAEGHTEELISKELFRSSDMARGEYPLLLEPPIPSSASERSSTASQRAWNIVKQPFETVTSIILVEWRDLVTWYKDPCPTAFE